MSIDASEVTNLGRTLVVSVAAVEVGARAVMAKAALNVKNDARQRISGLRHARGYPNSIKYETKFTAGTVEALVGPEVGGPQWGLGDILEYGTVNSAPHPHLMPAAEAELPKMEKYLAEVAVKALP